MKATSLRHLQELIDEVKWIDDKISQVDIHIGQLYDVVHTGRPPIFDRRERTIIIEGCMYQD
jgi:hypothetical protein